MILLLGTTPYYITDIDTIPSSLGNILATGYSPITVTVTIEGYPLICFWEYGEISETRLEFFDDVHYFGCYQNSNTQAHITCVKEDRKITSTLTLTQPLRKGSLNIRVNCHGDREDLPTITVKGTAHEFDKTC